MIYEYQCVSCGKLQEAYRKVNERNDCPPCECGSATCKIISSYAVVPDVDPHWDDNLQSYVKSKQHRAQVMREQGVYERFGKGWH